MLIAHFGVRAVMHEAALDEWIEPDELSFAHAVCVVERYLPQYVSFPPRSSSSICTSGWNACNDSGPKTGPEGSSCVTFASRRTSVTWRRGPHPAAVETSLPAAAS